MGYATTIQYNKKNMYNSLRDIDPGYLLGVPNYNVNILMLILDKLK